MYAITAFVLLLLQLIVLEGPATGPITAPPSLINTNTLEQRGTISDPSGPIRANLSGRDADVVRGGLRKYVGSA